MTEKETGVDSDKTKQTFCQNCGAPIHSNDKICVRCGVQLGSIPVRKNYAQNREKFKQQDRLLDELRTETVVDRDVEKTPKEAEASVQNELTDTQRLRLTRARDNRNRLNYEDYVKIKVDTEPEKKGGLYSFGRSFKAFWRHRNPLNGLLMVLLLSIVIFVFLSGYAFYKYVEQNAKTAEFVVDQFEAAVNKGDYGSLGQTVAYADSKDPIDYNALEPFVKKLSNDATYKTEVVDKLRLDAEKFSADPEYVSEGLIKLSKTGEAILGIDEYQILIGTIQVRIAFPQGNNFFIDEQEVVYSTTGGDLNLIPGTYTTTFSSGDFKLKNNLDVSEKNERLVDGILNVFYEDLSIAGSIAEYKIVEGNYDLELYTTDSDAIVFVNGLNTTLTVENFNAIEEKNLKEGDNIQIIDKAPWGLVSSPTHILEGESWARVRIGNYNNLNRE